MGKTLLEHAAYELTRAGLVDHPDPEARKTATDTMALIKRFVKQNHNNVTGHYVLEFFQDLTSLLPLTPITDDPKEWTEFEITTKNKESDEENVIKKWESTRSPSIISDDGGKTWVEMNTGKTGTSIDHVKEKARRDDERRKQEEAYKKSLAEKNNTGEEAKDGKSEKSGTEAPTESQAKEDASAETPKAG